MGNCGNKPINPKDDILLKKEKKTQYDTLYKLLLLGDAGVGKTSIVFQWVEGAFQETYIATIGVDFKVKSITIDDKTVKLQIWDTAGQERYSTITSTYYRGSHGILVVFDVTARKSFESVKKWLSDIEKFAESYVQVVLIGNKADLEAQRNVTYEEAKEFADKHGIPYYDCSAKNNTGVNEAFMELAKKIYDLQHQK